MVVIYKTILRCTIDPQLQTLSESSPVTINSDDSDWTPICENISPGHSCGHQQNVAMGESAIGICRVTVHRISNILTLRVRMIVIGIRYMQMLDVLGGGLDRRQEDSEGVK